jgi:hypothetical protein
MAQADPMDAEVAVAPQPAVGGAGAVEEFPAFATRPAGRPEAAGWSREKIVLLQRQLRRAGLLQPPYREGIFDAQTEQAYLGAIDEANRMGVGVPDALNRLASADIAMPASQAQPFQPRSPAELAQDVKSLWRQVLGRDPDDNELAEFSAAMTGMEREAHAANQSWDERTAQAQMGADLTGTPAWANMPALEEGEAEGPVSDEELAAQFMEKFEAAYKPEMQRNQRHADLSESRGGLLASITGMDAAIARNA